MEIPEADEEAMAAKQEVGVKRRGAEANLKVLLLLRRDEEVKSLAAVADIVPRTFGKRKLMGNLRNCKHDEVSPRVLP